MLAIQLEWCAAIFVAALGGFYLPKVLGETWGSVDRVVPLITAFSCGVCLAVSLLTMFLSAVTDLQKVMPQNGQLVAHFAFICSFLGIFTLESIAETIREQYIKRTSRQIYALSTPRSWSMNDVNDLSQTLIGEPPVRAASLRRHSRVKYSDDHRESAHLARGGDADASPEQSFVSSLLEPPIVAIPMRDQQGAVCEVETEQERRFQTHTEELIREPPSRAASLRHAKMKQSDERYESAHVEKGGDTQGSAAPHEGHKKSFVSSLLEPPIVAIPVRDQQGECTVCEVQTEQGRGFQANPTEEVIGHGCEEDRVTGDAQRAAKQFPPTEAGRHRSPNEWFCRGESFALHLGIGPREEGVRGLHTCGGRSDAFSSPGTIPSRSRTTTKSGDPVDDVLKGYPEPKEPKLKFYTVPTEKEMAKAEISPMDTEQAFATERLSDILVAFIIFILFSIHSLLEGFGLGLSTSTAAIGIGILSHKSLAAFTIGSSVLESGIAETKFFFAAVLFSSMTPIGVMLGGTAIVYDAGGLYTGIFSGFAAGTFCFIALQELLPKAFQKPERRFMKLLCLLLGTSMVCLQVFLHVD